LNHAYAEDLLDRMQELGLRCCTTEKLFKEVQDHAWWAIVNFVDSPPDDTKFLHAAMAGPGYRQNLFVDGFVKWSLAQGAPSLHRYMHESLGSNYREDLPGCIRTKIRERGVEVVDFSDWPGFSQESWPERDDISGKIAELRTKHGTFRTEAQCVAEAEVVLITEMQEAAFLSQSSILNRLERTQPRMTWKPEAMYRFLSLFSSAPTGTDLLYECMMQSFYYAGFDIVDKSVISRYVAPMVRQARMQLDQARQQYQEALGKREFAELRDGFERVPDEQKPFYSMQFAYLVAAREALKREKAEARAKRAEHAKGLTEQERQEFERLKQDKRRRQKKQERKRRKYASRPNAKGKKGKKK
jgi:hypothetical protein